MQIPSRLFKWTQLGGLCWGGSRIQIGRTTECPDWELSREIQGPGFGIGVCADPIEMLEYLPPNLYVELYEVEPVGELQEIRSGSWRCQGVSPIRIIPREQQIQFNSDKRIIAVSPEDWLEVLPGMRAFGFEDARIIAHGGITRAYDRAMVYADGKACVECYQDAQVIATAQSRVYRRGYTDPGIYDRSQDRVLR